MRFFLLDPPLAEGDLERSCQSGKIVIYHHSSGDLNWVFSNSVVTHTTSITWDPTRLIGRFGGFKYGVDLMAKSRAGECHSGDEPNSDGTVWRNILIAITP